MSSFDYFWKAEAGKEGLTFAEVIDKSKMSRKKALKCLKDAGLPIISDDEILTLRQFQALKRRSLDLLLSEMEQRAIKVKSERALSKEYFEILGSPIKGINNHRTEPKSVLRERLEEIAKGPTEFMFFDGAMCYSRVFPNVEVTIEHKCPTCGTVYIYKDWGFKNREATDRYAIEDRKIDQYVEEIKDLGYDVFVEHMCGTCYGKKYGKNEECVSINVLNFKHVDDENYIVNPVSSIDCRVLAEFLKGNNAYKGTQDETMMINKYRSVLERLLDIKIEK